MNIVIYGKPNCPSCTMAKSWLDARSIPYDYKQLDTDFVREDLVAVAPAARSYPVVFVNGDYVGGFQQMTTVVMAESAFSGNGPSLLTEG